MKAALYYVTEFKFTPALGVVTYLFRISDVGWVKIYTSAFLIETCIE